MEKNLNAGQKAMQKIFNKAWDDSAYLKELQQSPKEAIERVTGKEINIPEGVSIKVNDQTEPGIVFINIPPKPDHSSMELTDEQLEKVAGGELTVSTVVGVTLASAALSYTISSDW